ncbi:MAG: outer membrane beta-barrel protein [Beijerinckiaceae bacterium]|jgi:opacity protein-like surface antigen|nr:outer membrane beta-barrel protein [Beijerinckiaceae bacterium]
MSESRILSSTGMALAAAVVTLAASSPASALDWLRGSFSGQHQVDWSGVYGGVHAGITSGQTDPRPLAPSLAQNALPNSSITDLLEQTIFFKETNKQGMSYGGFIGMNWQWDDVVLGWEADYSRSNIKSNTTTGPNGLMRTQGSDEWQLTSTSTSRGEIKDWGTIRGRVGYAMGIFMPYLTAGVAIGNLNSRASTSGSWERYDVSTPPARPLVGSANFAGVVGRSGVTYGGAVGAGVDMQFLPNTFLRGEWQYIQFASGGLRPNVSINTARVAGGVKF